MRHTYFLLSETESLINLTKKNQDRKNEELQLESCLFEFFKHLNFLILIKPSNTIDVTIR